MLNVQWNDDSFEVAKGFTGEPLTLMVQAIESYRAIKNHNLLKSKDSDVIKRIEFKRGGFTYQCIFHVEQDTMVITEVSKQ